MRGTSEQEPKSTAASPLKKLVRMLRSMSQRHPTVFLVGTTGGFGARLGDGRYLHIVSNGEWTNEELRDWLALFATWLVADPDGLRRADIRLGGALLRDLEQRKP